MKPGRQKKPYLSVPPSDTTTANVHVRGKLKIILAITCAVIAVLLYINTWDHGYVLDDVAVIEQNRFTQMGIQGIPHMLTTFYWEGYWSSNAGLYRPLSLITFAVEQELSPGNASISHAGNILLYALIAFLLFNFLNMLFEDKHLWLALSATLIFVLHPVHTEVVANIKSRDELLCFLFFILAANSWMKWHKSQRRGHIALAALFYLLSLFSKEGAVVFLPIFPLMVYFFRGVSPKASLRGLWVMALPLVLFLIVHTWVIQTSPHPRISYTYQDNALLAAPDLLSRTATALSTTLHYFRLLFWPHPLSHDYSFNQVPVVGFNDPRALAGLALVAGLAVLAVRGFRQRTLLSFAILYFALTFSLTSNLIIPIGATMAERFLFTPSLALALLAGFVIDKYLVKGTGRYASLKQFAGDGLRPFVILTVLALPMAVLTVQRNAHWKDDLELFTADLNTVPHSARAHYNYASAYMNEVAFRVPAGEQPRAFVPVAKELGEAVAIDSNYYDAWHNLGIARYHLAEYAQALASLEKAVQLKNDNGSDFYWMGKSHFRLNRFEEALSNLEKGRAMGVKMEDTYNLMGTAGFNLGRYAEAIHYYEESLKEKPGDTEVMNNLAGAHAMTGNYAEAIGLLLRSYELHPGNANTCYFLAISYHKSGDTANAELWAQKARELGMNI